MVYDFDYISQIRVGDYISGGTFDNFSLNKILKK